MIGLGLGLWGAALRGGPALGPELRGTGTPGIFGTATDATYNTTTGAGSVTRVDSANQSFIDFTGLAASSTYRIDIANTGSLGVYVRQGSRAGTILQTVPAGQSVTVDVSTGATTALTITATAAGTATFTVNSLRKVG